MTSISRLHHQDTEILPGILFLFEEDARYLLDGKLVSVPLHLANKLIDEGYLLVKFDRSQEITTVWYPLTRDGERVLREELGFLTAEVFLGEEGLE